MRGISWMVRAFGIACGAQGLVLYREVRYKITLTGSLYYSLVGKTQLLEKPMKRSATTRSALRRSARQLFLAGLSAGVAMSLPTPRAEAWFDGWCCSKKPAPAYPVGSPFPVTSGMPGLPPVTPIVPSNGGMTSYYGNYGVAPPSPGTFLPAGVPQTVVGAMPTAAYDTQWQRTPVTYYRPVTQFDPNYGTTVTALQPCTSYQYQAQRVPLVAPAPMGGPYAYDANRWPAVNAPGYYPTGMVATNPSLPTYPSVQQIPTTGMNYAANVGSSSGPTSTLPVRTMGFGTVPGTVMPSSSAGMAPAMSPVATAVYMGAPNNQLAPVSGMGVSSNFGSVPAAAWSQASPVPVGAPTMVGAPMVGAPMVGAPMVGGPVGSSQVTSMAAPNPSSFPAGAITSMSPSASGVYCPNGTCPPAAGASTAMPVPNIPGAASVVPYGPPTYQKVPTPPVTSSVTPFPSTTPVPGVGSGVMSPSNVVNPGDLNPVLPPGATSSDPEAARPPSLLNSAPNPAVNASKVAGLVPLQRLPMVSIDRAASSETRYPTSSNVSSYSPAAAANPFNSNAPTQPSAALTLPSLGGVSTPLSGPTSQPANQSPLTAPDSFDAAPRWNPKLLPPPNIVPEETVASTSKLKSASHQRWVSSTSASPRNEVTSPTFRPVTGP
jgi:hypothetical protein